MSALSTSQIKIKPREQLGVSSKIFTFDLPTLGEYFPNLSTLQIYVKGSVKRSTGTKLTKNEQTAVCNNFLNSLFRKVTITIGENQSKLVYNDYPYTALLHIIDNKKSQNQCNRLIGYTPDSGIITPDGKKVNFQERIVMCAESKVLHFMGNLECGLVNMNSFLLKNTPFSIELEKSDSSFIIDTTQANKYDFFIQEIALFCDMILPNPDLTAAIEEGLHSRPAIYKFEHLSLKKFVIPKSVTSYTINRLWNGDLGRRFCFALISQIAYQGSDHMDPMMLPLSNIRSINLKVNERQLMNIDLTDGNLSAYLRFIQFTQTDGESLISKSTFDYSQGYIVLDLNTLCNEKEMCISEIHPQGTLSCDIEFIDETRETCVLLMYTFNEGSLQIDGNRNAMVSITVG